MAEFEALSGRYLRHVLVDGSRNFRYRHRVRGLLGLPKSEGVKVRFGLAPANMMNFTYNRPQFMGEFYFDDEFPDKPAHSLTYIEDEFMNLPLTHPGSDLQRGEPVKDLSDRKPHFSESSINRLVAKANQNTTGERDYSSESAHFGNGIQEPTQADRHTLMESPSLASAPVQTATMSIPKIPERRKSEEPGQSKGEAKHAAEIQLFSGSGGEQPILAQGLSNRNLPHKVETTQRTQTELWSVDTQAQSGESLSHIQLGSSKPSITHLQTPGIAEPAQATLLQIEPFIPPLAERQTPKSTAPPQSALPSIKPKVKKTQRLDWNEEELEEQEWNIGPSQLPPMKMRARDRAAVPQPTSSRTKRETKPEEPSPTGQGQMPTASQQVDVLGRGIEPQPKTYAFWERRHLHHHRLRLLR